MKKSEVTDSLKSMNWPQLRSVLEGIDEDVFDCVKLTRWIRQAENIVSKYSDKKRTDSRRKLLNKLKGYIHDRFGESQSVLVESLENLFPRLESGYELILADRLTGGVENLSPQERIQSALNISYRTLKRNTELINRNLEEVDSISNAMVLTDDGGAIINPDVEVTASNNVTHMTMMIEGFGNKWFDNDGYLILPELAELNAEDQLLAESSLMNALAWRNWQQIDERIRYLDYELVDVGSQQLPQGFKSGSICRPKNPEFEFMDIIANDRWKRQLIQNAFERYRLIRNSLKPKGLSEQIAIGKGLFISEQEVMASVIICERLYHDIITDPRTYHGLRLSEWIRGYAVLQQYITENIDLDNKETVFPKKPFNSWVRLLEEFGLTPDKATLFLRHITFRKGCRDLFDCPMIKFQNGDMMLYGPALNSIEISEVVFSLLGSLGTIFDDKGNDFEDHMIDFLNGQEGVVAKTFKTKKDGEDYQFDIIMKFDGRIFHFELKNCTLSKGVIQRIYYDYKRLGDHIKQTKRLADALDKYPEILDNLFGEGASDLSRLDCVLYAAPYSYPEGFEDIYVYDAQSLCRLFKKRHVSLTSQINKGSAQILVPISVADIWGQENLSAEILTEQMQFSHQVSLACAHRSENTIYSKNGPEHIVAREEINVSSFSNESVAEHFDVDHKKLMKEIGKIRELAKFNSNS